MVNKDIEADESKKKTKETKVNKLINEEEIGLLALYSRGVYTESISSLEVILLF